MKLQNNFNIELELYDHINDLKTLQQVILIYISVIGSSKGPCDRRLLIYKRSLLEFVYTSFSLRDLFTSRPTRYSRQIATKYTVSGRKATRILLSHCCSPLRVEMMFSNWK